MPCYDDNLGWRVMYWACVECLVRPMCNERCDRTYFKHYLCESCKEVNKCEEYPCKEVKTRQMYKTVFNAYGYQIMEAWNKQIEQHSIFKLFKPPDKSFDNWWIAK